MNDRLELVKFSPNDPIAKYLKQAYDEMDPDGWTIGLWYLDHNVIYLLDDVYVIAWCAWNIDNNGQLLINIDVNKFYRHLSIRFLRDVIRLLPNKDVRNIYSDDIVTHEGERFYNLMNRKLV